MTPQNTVEGTSAIGPMRRSHLAVASVLVIISGSEPATVGNYDPLPRMADRTIAGPTGRIGLRPAFVPWNALSQEAWDARRPPAPVSLLDAEWERPDIPAKARIVRVVRTRRSVV